MTRVLRFLTFTLMILASGPAGADITLDPSFGTAGIARTSFGSGNIDVPRDLLVLPDGRILAAGYSTAGYQDYWVAMARYGPDGLIDSTGFGNGGKVFQRWTFRNYVNAIAVQADGKIVGAGLEAESNFGSQQIPAIYRFLADGAVDTTFASQGRSSHRYDPVSSGEHAGVMLLPDGRIVAAGSCNANANGGTNGFGRKIFLANGTQSASLRRDHSLLFDRGSCAFTGGSGVLWANTAFLNGRVELILAKVDSAGNPDTRLGPAGIRQTGLEVRNARELKAILLPSGRILVGATTPRDVFFDRFTLFGFNADGLPDNTFGSGGRVDIDFTTGMDRFYDMAVDALGRILLVGEAQSGNSFAGLARRLPDGAPDLSFGPAGRQIFDLGPNALLTRVVILSDGRILVAGSDFQDFILARFNDPVSAVNDATAPAPIPLRVFPNPVRETATIDLRLPGPGPVSLVIFDVAGRRVRSLVSEALPAGSHEIRWDGRDDAGGRTPAGAYFLKLATPAGLATRALIRVR